MQKAAFLWFLLAFMTVIASTAYTIKRNPKYQENEEIIFYQRGYVC